MVVVDEVDEETDHLGVIIKRVCVCVFVQVCTCETPPPPPRLILCAEQVYYKFTPSLKLHCCQAPLS